MEVVTQICTTAGGLLAALGGFEFIKWLVTRKTGKRKEDAEADGSEFSVLKDTTIFLQEQLRLKEERFASQTNRVRELTDENLRLIREVSMLKAEREIKLCEVRACPGREPQSGY